MSYPKAARWISVEKQGPDDYIIRDNLNDDYGRTDAVTANMAMKLDGYTDPYSVDPSLSERDVRSILHYFEENGITRNLHILQKSAGQMLLTIWEPVVTNSFRAVAFILNNLLMISWLPLFIFSLWFINNNFIEDVNISLGVGVIVGTAAGMFMHEFAHMCAGVGYGCEMYEMGIMIGFRPGAYVLMKESDIKKRMHRVQVYAAGVEMNFFLSAVFLILAGLIKPAGCFFLGCAINNILLGALNLTFLDGIDGMRILAELLGLEDIVDRTKRIVKNKSRARRLSANGIHGKAAVAMSFLVQAGQLMGPMLFIVNIIGVISCFL